MRVLIVEDDKTSTLVLTESLDQGEYDVTCVQNGVEALKLHEKHPFPLVITDWRMPGMDGLELIQRIRKQDADQGVYTYVVLVTSKKPQGIVEGLDAGADEFLTKPISPHEFNARVRAAKRLSAAFSKLTAMSQEIDRLTHVDEVIDQSGNLKIVNESGMLDGAIQDLRRAAQTDAPILLLGETGTGKEIFARLAHKFSNRADEIFGAINCAAIPENLAESELFGHEQGAFTTAERSRKGRFEEYAKGTLFLDEIGDLHPAIQTKLLRVIENKEFSRVGGNEVITSNVRLIAATNKDLTKALQDNSFRRELYARLNVFEIVLPPLRDRKADIQPLAQQYLDRFSREQRKLGLKFSPQALSCLINYHWPYNIRELRNVVERAVAFSDSIILPNDLRLDGPAAQSYEPVINRGSHEHSDPGPEDIPSNRLGDASDRPGFHPKTFLHRQLVQSLEPHFRAEGIELDPALNAFEVAVFEYVFNEPSFTSVGAKSMFLGLSVNRFDRLRAEMNKRRINQPNDDSPPTQV